MGVRLRVRPIEMDACSSAGGMRERMSSAECTDGSMSDDHSSDSARRARASASATREEISACAAAWVSRRCSSEGKEMSSPSSSEAMVISPSRGWPTCNHP